MAKKVKAKKTVKVSVKGKEKRLQNLTPFSKGESGNPNGRPKGQRNYATIYRDALIKFADSKGKTPEEIEDMFEQVGFVKALTGDHRFYKDFRDRIHGQARQTTELTGKDGKDLIPDSESKESADAVIASFINQQKK